MTFTPYHQDLTDWERGGSPKDDEQHTIRPEYGRIFMVMTGEYAGKLGICVSVIDGDMTMLIDDGDIGYLVSKMDDFRLYARNLTALKAAGEK